MAVPVVAGEVPELHASVILGGHVGTGGAASLIVIIWIQAAVSPQLSVAVHVRVIMCAWGHEPLLTTSV